MIKFSKLFSYHPLKLSVPIGTYKNELHKILKIANFFIRLGITTTYFTH